MDEDWYGSGGVLNISPEFTFGDVVISVYQCGYLQVELCDVDDCFSVGVEWNLDQIEDL